MKYVYIVDKKGNPLMPTTRFEHVRKLLKEGKAVPICNSPFTIKLKYDVPGYAQPVYEGIDIGRENIGDAASLENVVFWNANGGFRKKCSTLFALDADVYIVAECENPSCYTFPDSCKNYIWTGEKKQRGLAVFAKENILLQKDDWLTGALRCFLPFKANGRQFVGVWACKPYIEEYFVWQSLNMKNIDADTVIIGDFNSNSMWDYKHGTRNHTAVVNQLKEKGLVSAYHFTRNEAQGHEREYTFFQYRHLDKGYHIDYVFCSENMIKSMIIHNDMQWHELSDHLPLQLVFEHQNGHI